jgi:hypothetical protein
MERVMEDIEVPDDQTADPASPEAEEESSVAEETAETDDAAQAEGAEDETPEKDEADEGEKGTESAKGRSESVYDKLLKKYGGDKDAMAVAYFEQANSVARMHERLQPIEEFIKGQREAPVDEAKLIAADPDVQALNEEYAETEAEKGVDEKELRSIITQYGQAEKKVSRLEGKLESADPDAQLQIRQDLADARAESNRLRADASKKQSDIQTHDKDLKKLARQIKGAEQEAREKVSRQRQAKLERDQQAQEVRQELAEAMLAEAKEYGIDPESRTYGLLFTSVRARIVSYLATLPKGPDIPGVSIPEAVHSLMAEYVEDMELKGKFQKASALKRSTVAAVAKSKPVVTLKPKDVAPPKDGRWTADYVRARAKRMLG